MSQNSEQIEAKLCAYLEGELDESGRAEIEKHLQQNPAHRKLLVEVGKTRNLLRALPREPAPPDICEAFQGQLERSVLLADLDDEGGSSSMKINRWPQYLAVAAVVILAAGLGMVVYFGLPSGTRDGNYAIDGGGTSAARTEDGLTTRSVAPVDSTSSLAAKPDTAPANFARSMDRDGAASFEIAPDTLEKKKLAESLAAGIPPAASGPAVAPAEELNVLARRVQGSWQLKERRDLFTATGVSEATLQALDNLTDSAACYVVTTAQPGVAAEQIGRELSRMQVAWSEVPRPDPAALQMKLETQVRFGEVQQTQALQQETMLKDAAAADESVALAPHAPVAQQPTAGAVFRGTRGDTAAGMGAAIRQETVAGQNPAGGTRAPATQPTQELAAAADNESELADVVPALRARGFARAPDGSGRAETLIVARGLTLQQAESLRASLDVATPERQVAAFGARRGAADAKALADAPAVAEGVVEAGRTTGAGGGSGGPSPANNAVIQQGDALRLVTARGQGEHTVTEVQVAQNGTVTIPGVGLFRCEGLTLAQLQERVATDSRTVGTTAVGKLVEVTKVEKAQGVASVPASEPGPLAAATESDVAQRGVRRARNDVMLRGGVERPAVRAPGQAPAAAAEPVSPPASARSAPAPTVPAATAPAPTAGPAAPAPRYAEVRGGAAGAAGSAPDAGAMAQSGSRPDALADKLAQADINAGVQTRSAATSLAKSMATTGPADGEERFDVVILVRNAGPAGASTDLQHVDASGAPLEPGGPIERYEILMIQLGDTEADLANVRVGDDGMVELPKVGRVQAAGRTAAELRDEITTKLPANAAEAKASEVTVKRLGNADASAAPSPDPARPESGPAEKQPAPGASAPGQASPDTPAEVPATNKPTD